MNSEDNANTIQSNLDKNVDKNLEEKNTKGLGGDWNILYDLDVV